MRDVNIKRLLFVGIEHLCQSTLDMLEAESLHDSGGMSSAITYQTQLNFTIGRWGDLAWFTWVPDKETDHLRDPIPADMAMIFEYARQHGCEYLVIEATDDIIPDLPVYPKE